MKTLFLWILSGWLMYATMSWVSRSRNSLQPAARARLRHPASTLILGVIGLTFFGGIAVISNVYKNKTTTWLTTTAFIVFALCFVALIVEYFRVHHELSNDGMDFGRLFGPRGRLRWSEVSRLHYSYSMKWFRVETRSGQVARISAMLTGLPQFARIVLAQVPAAAIDPETQVILQDAASGRLPNVWEA